VPFIWEEDFFIDVKRPNERGKIPLGEAYLAVEMSLEIPESACFCGHATAD
jgi:hypothetical protein